MSGAKFGADTFGVTSNLNMKNVNADAGLAPNENCYSSVFQRMEGMRTFSFRFELSSKK